MLDRYGATAGMVVGGGDRGRRCSRCSHDAVSPGAVGVATDLDAEPDRSRCGVRPISAGQMAAGQAAVAVSAR